MKKRRVVCFTLIELIVSMAVFALMGLMVAQLFSASQKLWTSNNQKTQLSADGRMALDMLTGLLTSASSTPPAWNNDDSAAGDPVPLDDFAGGYNFFDLSKNATAVGSTSKILFSTKTDHKALKTNRGEEVTFVGIQLVDIPDTASDPDAGSSVLLATFVHGQNIDFSAADLLKDVQNSLDPTAADKNFSTDSTRAVRIAGNVVDFQVRACQSVSDIDGAPDSGNDTVAELPAALRVTLTLMDRDNFLTYKDTGDTKLRDQFARSFTRIIWLDRTRNEDIIENLY